jgi:hypothetical protein
VIEKAIAAKDVTVDQSEREKMLRGVDSLIDAVNVTLVMVNACAQGFFE